MTDDIQEKIRRTQARLMADTIPRQAKSWDDVVAHAINRMTLVYPNGCPWLYLTRPLGKECKKYGRDVADLIPHLRRAGFVVLEVTGRGKRAVFPVKIQTEVIQAYWEDNPNGTEYGCDEYLKETVATLIARYRISVSRSSVG